MSDNIHTESGAFEKQFADNKNWKIDQSLLSALLYVIPQKSSVVDLGAGYGKYVLKLREHGYTAYGLDGIYGVEEATNGVVVERDLSQPFEFSPKPQWAMTIEVGEHIPPEKTNTFIENVSHSATDGIIVSWARIGQRGRDHVACHSPEYIAQKFAWWSWMINEEKMYEARKIAGKGWDRKLLVFCR